MNSNGTEEIWKSLQGTPQQMGIDYAVKVFANQNLTPGATAALQQDPPFRFLVGMQQMLLPPPVTKIGAPVPRLPDGATVVWAPSFMGVPIPTDMISPIGVNGRLIIDPLEIQSAGGSGNQTNAKLLANNKMLLNLLMSVVGALVNSYSSRPYSNPAINNGAFATLSHYILDLRDKADFLSPQPDRGTVLQGIASPLGTVFGTVANFIVPGSGSLVGGAVKKAASSAGGKINNAANNNTSTALTQLLPVPGSGVSGIVSAVKSNPVPYIIAAIILIIIFYLIFRR